MFQFVFQTNTIRTIDSRTSVRTLKKAVKRRRTMAKVAIFLMFQFIILWAPHWGYTLRYYFSYDRETLLWYLMDLIGLVCIYLNAALTPFTIVLFNRGFRHQLGNYLCCCCSCFNCCVRSKKKKEPESPLPSTSDISKKSSRKCCLCCYGDRAGTEDSDSVSSQDVTDKPGYKQNADLSNLYQELPGQNNFYDSYTIPLSSRAGEHHNGQYTAPNGAGPTYHPYGSPYDTLPVQRSSYAVAVNGVDAHYHPSSYHGDDGIVPFEYDQPPYGYNDTPGAPRLVSYHPHHRQYPEHRYISEPLLHAQAPKYSKIMPGRHSSVKQATSIKEIPAL